MRLVIFPCLSVVAVGSLAPSTRSLSAGATCAVRPGPGPAVIDSLRVPTVLGNESPSDCLVVGDEYANADAATPLHCVLSNPWTSLMFGHVLVILGRFGVLDREDEGLIISREEGVAAAHSTCQWTG